MQRQTGQREEEEEKMSSSRYCSSAFESLFFETFKTSRGGNIEDQMKEYAAMEDIQHYDAAKEKLWAKSFIPRFDEQTRRRRANAGKNYYNA